MSDQTILIVDHGNFEENFLERIAFLINKEFLLPVTIEHNHIDLSEFYDPKRRQYNGNKLLKEVDANTSLVYDKIMGLYRVDLFIPILTYIFGQAELKGSAGIASMYRLRNELYGMKKNEELLLKRFSKVIIHEIGHMFGLIHCYNPSCVMRSSTYVEDLDLKSMTLCSNCKDLSSIS